MFPRVHPHQSQEVISVEACMSFIFIFNCLSFILSVNGHDGLGGLSTVQFTAPLGKSPSELLRGPALSQWIVLSGVFEFCPIVLTYICALLTCDLNLYPLCYVLITLCFRCALVS